MYGNTSTIRPHQKSLPRATEVVPRRSQTRLRSGLRRTVKLNSDKCKEFRISFAKDEPQFASIVVDGKELERLTSAKLLGLTISSNLTWNDHISDVIMKASKRLYL